MPEVKQRLLTAEQMTMYRQKHTDDSADTAPEDRKRLNRKLRQQLEAMSPADLAAARTAMQADWDALPAEKRAKVQERIAAKAAKRAAKHAEDDDDD